MEAFQLSYLRAIAAAAGCVFVGKPEIDEGIDAMLTHTSDQHQYDGVATLCLQLKATSQPSNLKDRYISTKLRRERYDFYRQPRPTVGKIILIMAMPKDQAHWVYARERKLSLHYCSYWVNIEGETEKDSEQVTVRAPTSQVFSDVALCNIMERIGKGGKP